MQVCGPDLGALEHVNKLDMAGKQKQEDWEFMFLLTYTAALRPAQATEILSQNKITERDGKWYFPLPSGQSYEIRLLENRKLGDFQDLNTKYVKVSEHSHAGGGAL